MEREHILFGFSKECIESDGRRYLRLERDDDEHWKLGVCRQVSGELDNYIELSGVRDLQRIGGAILYVLEGAQDIEIGLSEGERLRLYSEEERYILEAPNTSYCFSELDLRLLKDRFGKIIRSSSHSD